MKVLIIGNGGREHALAWKAAQSPLVKQVYVAPGNAGTALEPSLINIDIAVNDIEGLLTFAQHKQIDLTIVGPEAPLAAGVVDLFQQAGLAIFGPVKAAAQLESSKAFTKEFLTRHHIPTARYAIFTEISAAHRYIRQQGVPIVIKADGLAAGKGVIVAMSLAEAETAVINMLSGNTFGEAGHRVIIEEFLEGEEASFIVMSDGVNVLPMATSQDHKRVGDADSGPNTGGMGAYSPAPIITHDIFNNVMQKIIYPTIQGMKAEGYPYMGFLYAGLMIDKHGHSKLIEFNCRFGDPEAQPIMLRMRSDLVEHCLEAIKGNLNSQIALWHQQAALGVVMASRDYPDNYRVGDEIIGLPDHETKGEKVFHAGSYLSGNKVITSGGRVLCVTALGDNVTEAQQRAYRLVKKIYWSNCFYRQDIGFRAVNREKLKYF